MLLRRGLVYRARLWGSSLLILSLFRAVSLSLTHSLTHRSPALGWPTRVRRIPLTRQRERVSFFLSFFLSSFPSLRRSPDNKIRPPVVRPSSLTTARNIAAAAAAAASGDDRRHADPCRNGRREGRGPRTHQYSRPLTSSTYVPSAAAAVVVHARIYVY